MTRKYFYRDKIELFEENYRNKNRDNDIIVPPSFSSSSNWTIYPQIPNSL